MPKLVRYRGAFYRRVSETEGDRYRLRHFNEPSFTTQIEEMEGVLEEPSTPSEKHYPDLLQTPSYMPADESWMAPWWMDPSHEGKKDLYPPTYEGVNFRRVSASPDDFLYHSTFLFYLSSIQEVGLVPGGQRNWQTYDTAGKLYFSGAKGVYTWNYKLHDLALDKSDHPVEEGWIPITLRVPRDALDEQRLLPDEEGTRDGGGQAYYTTQKVPADQIEIWTGSAWAPVEQEDEYELREQALQLAPRETPEDEEELVYLDEKVFFPKELHP
jgi:hypothetical protein